jgi:hypothetical protein
MFRRLLTALRDRVLNRPPDASREPDEASTHTLAAVALVLLSELPPEDTADRIELALARLGISREAIRAASDLLVPHIHPPSLARTPALAHTARHEAVYQSAYLVNAARRLTMNPDALAERVILARHLNAAKVRREAAERIDRMSLRFGPVLGWYARLDSRTTSECRRASGNNFPAARPPRIGYPGTLHGGACRCVPGPMHRDGRTVDQVAEPVAHG